MSKISKLETFPFNGYIYIFYCLRKKMNLKLKPSAKIKRRYLLIEAKDKKEIEQVIFDYVGILGWAKAVPAFINPFKYKSNKIILAIDRKALTEVRASFELSEKKIKIIKVSGTLKNLLKK